VARPCQKTGLSNLPRYNGAAYAGGVSYASPCDTTPPLTGHTSAERPRTTLRRPDLDQGTRRVMPNRGQDSSRPRPNISDVFGSHEVHAPSGPQHPPLAAWLLARRLPRPPAEKETLGQFRLEQSLAWNLEGTGATSFGKRASEWLDLKTESRPTPMTLAGSGDLFWRVLSCK